LPEEPSTTISWAFQLNSDRHSFECLVSSGGSMIQSRFVRTKSLEGATLLASAAAAAAAAPLAVPGQQRTCSGSSLAPLPEGVVRGVGSSIASKPEQGARSSFVGESSRSAPAVSSGCGSLLFFGLAYSAGGGGFYSGDVRGRSSTSKARSSSSGTSAANMRRADRSCRAPAVTTNAVKAAEHRAEQSQGNSRRTIKERGGHSSC